MIDSGDIAPVYPYWDVNLRRSKKLRTFLFRRLLELGLVGLRRRCRSRASIFFAKKKDGTQRMVIDGREPSSLHSRPPHVGLGSASAVSSLDISGLMTVTAAGFTSPVHGASADLRQGFYQMQWLEMARGLPLITPTELNNSVLTRSMMRTGIPGKSCLTALSSFLVSRLCRWDGVGRYFSAIRSLKIV